MKYQVTDVLLIDENHYHFEVSYDEGHTWYEVHITGVIDLAGLVSVPGFWLLLLTGEKVMVKHHLIRCKAVAAVSTPPSIWEELFRRKSPKLPTLGEVLSTGNYRWKDVGHNTAKRKSIQIHVSKWGGVFPSYHQDKPGYGGFDAGIDPEAIHALSKWLAAGHHKNQ